MFLEGNKNITALVVFPSVFSATGGDKMFLFTLVWVLAGIAATCCSEQGAVCPYAWATLGTPCSRRPGEQGVLWHLLTFRCTLWHFVIAVKACGCGGLQNASVSSASFPLPEFQGLAKGDWV